MSDSDAATEQLCPDDLEMDDRIEWEGHTYVVVGTGPGEATLDRVDDQSITMEVFRWAITGQVGIELETTVSPEAFEKTVEARGDSSE